jgi:hypothetical protein
MPVNLKDADHPSASITGWHGGMIHEDSRGAPDEGCFDASE